MLHFCGALGIDWKQGRFRDAGNYTPLLAGIMWIGRVILLEYALPVRPYATLNWPARREYPDYQWRLESLRRDYIIDGCLTPFGNMLRLMAYGKVVAKQMGRSGVVNWDADGEGLQIKDTRITLVGFRSFVHGIILEAKDILNKHLFFGVGQMNLDLTNMRDIMMERTNGFSLIDIETNRLGGGLRHMLLLAKRASPEKTLMKPGSEEWRRERVLVYLERKKRHTSFGVISLCLDSWSCCS